MVKSASKKKTPESLQKLKARIEADKKQTEQKRQEREAYLQKLQEEAAQKAEKYLVEYIENENQELANRRKAKEEGNFYVPAEAKVILAIRIKGIRNVPPKVRSILRLFRLIQIHSAVFIKNNKATMSMLRIVEPWVAYGYPSRQTISKLIYKRGYAKIDSHRVPLTENSFVEQNLGKYGINCVEDLVHEIVTCGPHFKQANAFFWRFKLSSPKGGITHKKTSYIQGGDWGNREQKINALVAKMI